MQKFEKVMIPLTLLLLVILGWMFISTSNEQSTAESTPQMNFYESKSGEMGAVMVEITPVSPSKYEITLNTHSVDLDFDFTSIIRLEDDLGNVRTPKSWSGSSGGHHLTGTLEFSDINSDMVSATIIVSEIEDEVLSLKWDF